MTTNAEPWLPNLGRDRLSDSRFTNVRYVSETGSTNADLLGAARRGSGGPLVLLTGHQSAGRGRQDRSWFDEPGDSLLVSVLITAARRWADLVPLATGLAAERAVNAYVGSLSPTIAPAGVSPAIAALKWPNDLLVPSLGERKLAGILVESTNVGEPETLAVVIGMGLNLQWSTEPPDEVRQKATTLAAAAAETTGAVLPDEARDRLLIEYLAALDNTLAVLSGPDGRELTIVEYRKHCLTVGRSIELETSTDVIAGLAVGIGDGGELMVETANGEVRSITAGDAHHRRSG